MPSRKDKRQPTPQVTPQRKEPPQRLRGIGDDPADVHPAWRLSLLDLDHAGSWSWSITPDVLQEITTFLSQMERLTWAEVRAQLTGGRRRGPKHKFIPIEHLCPEAQRRLEELSLDDSDEMFRFRLGNMRRLWGVIHESVFYPVWWDKDHKVCPSADPD